MKTKEIKRLQTTQSIVCPECHTVIKDFSQSYITTSYCGSCGKIILDAAHNFCGWCGEKIEVTA